MTFAVLISPRAARDLAALPVKVQRQAIAKLAQTADDPARFFRRLAGAKAYRLRVGDYRIIADIDPGAGEVRVLHIAHRKSVYKE